MKPLALVIASCVALLGSFYVVFPCLLRLYWWPRTAFGFSLAIVLAVSYAAALCLFWEELTLSADPVHASWLRVASGHLVLTALWLITEVIVLSIYRSRPSRSDVHERHRIGVS